MKHLSSFEWRRPIIPDGLLSDSGYLALLLDRPLPDRAAPRPRAALPLAPADRFPVSFENASRIRPAILSTAPSALSLLDDLPFGLLPLP